MKFRTSLLALAGTACISPATLQQSAQSPAAPNILFIIADDLGYYDLSYTGSRFYETPHIDRLASLSLEFTQGYATSPVSSPSRASVMTGQFTPRHGITDWIGAASGAEWRKQGRHTRLLPPEYKHHLCPETITLADALQQAGYKTFFSGKWHLGGQGFWPQDHGFDINVGGWNSGSPIGGYFDPYENPMLQNRKPGENLSMRLADETVSFLQNHHPNITGQPFFAFLSFYAVHGPLQTTREKWQKYREKAEQMGIASFGFEMEFFLPARTVQDHPLYAGLLEAMDEAVGHVLESLQQLGLADNTIIVFTSDQGGVSSGDAFATSNLPFRQGKGSTFEGGLRVPFFMKIPGLTRAGSKTDVPATAADFYPTLLDIIGADLKPEQHADGISLLPVIRGEQMNERPLFWHYPHYSNQGGRPSSVIRLGDWKLIHLYETNTQELYNLRTDIGERRDLAAMYPERVEAMKTQLLDYLMEVGALFPEKDPLHDPEAESLHLQNIATRRLQHLEQSRMQFLQPGFDPGNNWWGSQVN